MVRIVHLKKSTYGRFLSLSLHSTASIEALVISFRNMPENVVKNRNTKY